MATKNLFNEFLVNGPVDLIFCKKLLFDVQFLILDYLDKNQKLDILIRLIYQ